MSTPLSIVNFLKEPYVLTDEQVAFFEKNRYIKLKEVLNAETLAFYNEAISKRVNVMNTVNTKLEERSTYGKAFLQLFNLWREDDIVRELV